MRDYIIGRLFQTVCFLSDIKRTMRIKVQVRVLLLEYRLATGLLGSATDPQVR